MELKYQWEDMMHAMEFFLKELVNGDLMRKPILKSGWFVPGNGKALIKLKDAQGKILIAASQNKVPLKVSSLNKNVKTIGMKPLDVSAKIIYKNGKSRIVNIDYGSSFLSQSGRFLNVDSNVASIEIKDTRGNIRKVKM